MRFRRLRALAWTLVLVALPACGSGAGQVPGPILYAPVVLLDDTSIAESPEFLVPSIVGRQLPALIRFSTDAPEPLPVVIWSHGGGYSNSNHRASRAWSRVLARAGYAVIHVAHVAPTAAQLDMICRDVGVPMGECDDATITGGDPDDPNPFTSTGVCRASDAIAVLTHLPAIATHLFDTRGATIDQENVGVCGWSAGSSGPLQLAGSVRRLSATLTRFARPDARPKAFIAVSPQGPDFSGHFIEEPESSWDSVRGPVLMLTGDGDYKSKNGLDGPVRRLGFDRLPPGEKYLWYSTIEQGAGVEHGTFDMAAADRPNPDVARIQAGLAAVAYAFLDAYLRGHAPALAWLQSADPGAAGGGGAEWERR